MALAALSRSSDHRLKLLSALAGFKSITSETEQDIRKTIDTWPDDQSLIQYLTSRQLVTLEQINQAYARVYGIAFVPGLPSDARPEVLGMIPKATCLEYRLVAYKLEGKTLSIALSDPLHIKENQPGVLANLRKKTGLKFNLVMTVKAEFDRLIVLYPATPLPSPLEVAPAATIAPAKVVKTPPPADPFPIVGKVSLQEKQIEELQLRKVPLDIARQYRFVVFDGKGAEYSVASERPGDEGVRKLWSYLQEANHIRLHIFETGRADIDHALSQYQSMLVSIQGVIDLTARTIDQEALHKIPREVASKYRFVVFEQKDGAFLVAAEHPESAELQKILQYIEKNNHITILLYSSNSKSIDAALKQYEPKPVPIVDQKLLKESEPPPKSTSGSEQPALPASRAEEEESNGLFGKLLSSVGIGGHKQVIISETLVNQEPQPEMPPEAPSGKVSEAHTPPLREPLPEPEHQDQKATRGPTVIEIRRDAQTGEQIVEPAHPQNTTQGLYKQVAKAASEQQETDEDDLGSLLDKDVETLEELQTIVKSGYIPKIVAGLISYAITLHASDVHIEAAQDDVRVRYRVDGMLQDVVHLPIEEQAAIASRIKILSKLKIDETRIPQDGRFDVAFKDRAVDLRVSSMPMVHGEKIVMRILDKTHGIMSLEELGVVGRAFDSIIDAIKKPYGIVLSTGPTGSGKSTTLYAILNRISVPTVNIITLEDPVEYEIAGVNQSQIKPKIGFTFAEGLRSVLRQDPNIIMVGEIRDAETASMATHAALTGHLVLSTLHTNDAPGALPRLMNMGVEPFLITSSINVVEAQRLVRKTCQYCKEEIELPPAVIDEIKAELDKIPANNPKDRARVKDPMKFYHGKGCDKCQNGYKGRIGIYEVMPMSDEIEDRAIRKVAATEIGEQAIKEGMITMKQDGLLKALSGLTTVDEVMRETSV